MSKFQIFYSSQFKKDYKRIVKRGKDIKKLENVLEKLANGEELDQKYKDHELVSDWRGYRECHIMPDWLLIYKIKDEELILIAQRTGTHSDLF